MMTPWPSGKMKRSHCGLIVWRLTPGQDMRSAGEEWRSLKKERRKVE